MILNSRYQSKKIQRKEKEEFETKFLKEKRKHDELERIVETQSFKRLNRKDFEKLLEKLPLARLPRISSVVVPEFNLPGGRSRFFRYIWNLGTGV